MINNNFLEGIAKLLNNESYTLPIAIAFGSTSIVTGASDTIVSGEFSREESTSTRNTNTIKFVATRVAGDATGETLYNTALVNSSTLYSSDNIQANVCIPSILHTSDFDIDIEYWITINRG